MQSLLDMIASTVVIVLYFFIFILLHELGHAAFYRMVSGSNGWKITMGIGKPIFQSDRFVINSWFMMGGSCLSPGISKHIKLHRVLVSSGGFLVNTLLAILFYIFWQQSLLDGTIHNLIPQLLNIAMQFNVFLALTAIVPIVYPFGPARGKASDGLRIYRALFNKGCNCKDCNCGQ